MVRHTVQHMTWATHSIGNRQRNTLCRQHMAQVTHSVGNTWCHTSLCSRLGCQHPHLHMHVHPHGTPTLTPACTPAQHTPTCMPVWCTPTRMCTCTVHPCT